MFRRVTLERGSPVPQTAIHPTEISAGQATPSVPLGVGVKGFSRSKQEYLPSEQSKAGTHSAT